METKSCPQALAENIMTHHYCPSYMPRNNEGPIWSMIRGGNVMPVYMCRWPNGDFSVVKARNKDEAIEFLDEVDNAEGCPLLALEDFMAHFRLTDNGEFKQDSRLFGEDTQNQILRLGYPVLDKAFHDALVTSTDGFGGYTEKGQKQIRLAVAMERERVSAREVKGPKTLLGSKIKRMMDAPSKMIDKIVESEAMKKLEKCKGKGK